MIQGVIFDLGNTLMYLDGEWEQLDATGTVNLCSYLNERGYGIPVTFAETFRAQREAGLKLSNQSGVEYTAVQALNDALAQQSICWVPETALPRAVERYFEPEAERWRAYADAVSTLELLKAQGLKLGLLSNASDHAFVERLVQNAGLDRFFDPLLSSAKINHRKPDPRAFAPILDAWQLAPEQVVMVGDYPSFDILGAHRAGMWGVLIHDRRASPDAGAADASHQPPPHADFDDAVLMEPDAVIQELQELPDVLEMLQTKEMVNG